MNTREPGFSFDVRALRSDPLRWAVRRALSLSAGIVAAGFIGVPSASAGPFPAVFALENLIPANGGDGSAGFVLTGIARNTSSGGVVGVAGDVNGDGLDDVFVGTASADPGGQYNAGETFVVFGSTQGFRPVTPLAGLFLPRGGEATAGFVLTGSGKDEGDDRSAYSVSAAGDVNGDGLDDLVIGAILADPAGRHNAGISYVVFGSRQDFPAVLPLASLAFGDGSTGFVLTGISPSDYAGSSVSAAGDVNGDGIDDLIIGARGADEGDAGNHGESYVVFGSTKPFPAVFALQRLFPQGGGDGSAGFVLTGERGDLSGWSVSAAGDVNGDGVDDLIVGALWGGRFYEGASYVVFGSTEGFPPVLSLGALTTGDGSAGFVLTGIDERDFSGESVSAAGDVNGDGIDDLVVAAFAADQYAGENYVVFGSMQAFPPVLPLASLFPTGGGDGSVGFVLTGVHRYDNSGGGTAAGDINGDGIDDLIVGANGADPDGRENAGESYVVFGSTLGFPAVLPLASLLPSGGGDGSAGFVLTGIDQGDSSGSSVGAAGDVNGDGMDDLVIGATGADPSGRDGAGESYVVFGRGQSPLRH